MNVTLPTDAQARKDLPIVRGVLDYFPAAIAEVARVSKIGNDQHNPGQEMHHARGKSSDHADCIVRHLMDRGTIDSDGVRHAAKVAWRALALLQEELEAAGAPMARGARPAVPTEPQTGARCPRCNGDASNPPCPYPYKPPSDCWKLLQHIDDVLDARRS